MPTRVTKERFVRILPGRIRIEICGLLQNRQRADRLIQSFAAVSGVTKAEACPITGRMLLEYDEKKVSASELLRLILQAEQKEGLPSLEPEAAGPSPDSDLAAQHEAAASSEVQEIGSGDLAAHMESAFVTSDIPITDDVAEAIKTIPRAVGPPGTGMAAMETGPNKVPLPLAIAMGGLLALGAKQLLFGKSTLARSAIPFYMSGLISVVTGYPFLRRGVAQLGREKKINTDLLLGTGALALALVRENLVVLAGLSILQFVNWQKSRHALEGQPQVQLSPEIEAYSRMAGKLGIAAAAATWALTRDPLRGIAVLLAANPRPATLPAECAWNQAAVELKEHGMSLPSQGTLPGLARTRTLLLEDTSLLMHTKVYETGCTSQEEEPDKLICTVASLMEQTEHPWKNEVREKAKATCRTMRTAFRVKVTDGGIQGTINNAVYTIGTLAYCQKAGVVCENYYLESKRLQRRGCEVLFIAKMDKTSHVCLGLVYREQQMTADTQERLQRLYEQGFTVAPLRDGAEAGAAVLSGALGLNVDWLGASEGELVERIAAFHQQGEDVLLLTGAVPQDISIYLQEAGVPAASFDKLESLLDTYAGVRQVESTVQEHFRLTKKWNVVGSLLATVGVLSAPLVNLVADALSLGFMSRSQRTAATAFGGGSGNGSGLSSAGGEVAAAAEALQWHAAPWESIKIALGVSERFGLTPEQLSDARARFGRNELERRQQAPWLVSYLGQFKEFTTLVLLGTSVLAFFTGGVFDGLAMGAVLLANAAIGTFQERKAEQVLQSLNQFQPPETTVLRDGETVRISAAELVPGDIVSLEAGDRVPADLRIISSSNLEVNEAALTGESVPSAKRETPVTEDCPLSERNNMLYMGTDVSRGKALAAVIQTGMSTEIGKLMSLLKQDSKEVTPLQDKVTSISKTFIKWALVAGGLVFVAGLIRGMPMRQMITTSITLAASAIPEGLPVTITIALSAGIFRMAKKNVLVRKLSALETLGRTTIICSDKTGTLTKNEMTVKEIAAVGHRWSVTGNGYEPVGAIVSDSGASIEPGKAAELPPELQRILLISMLCNNSKLEQREGRWEIQGDPTEGALLSMAAKAGLQPEQLSHWNRCEEIPFDSNAARMSVVCKDTSSGHDCFLFSKGSVESILQQCRSYQLGGEVAPLTDAIKETILRQNETLARGALRVLGFAYVPLEGEAAGGPGASEQELIYLGMVGMMDPPKQDVEADIRQAYELGVKPVMITGDHPITAIAIAKQIGIYEEGSKVLSGHELERMADEELDAVVESVSIFARVTPEHKLRIVGALQRRGHVVAMTGDGVNDTPAIRQADVGIAMGRTGTEVTKETADMVLQEDRFSSIVEGVKEGRTIIGNIRKALGCLLTGNLAEILVTSAAVIAGLPIPLVPIQILLMNMLTDALPAMVLAVNPGNRAKQTKRIDIVDKQLYQKVVTRGILLGLGSLGLFAYALRSGAPLPVAQSVAFATLVAGQLIQTFSWRQEGSEESVRDIRKDWFMLGAMGVSSLALLAALYVPPLARFFHTAPLSAAHWIPILAVGASITLLSKPILALISRAPSGETDAHTVPALAAA